ncbi:hypothetical protein J6590_068980 [Homalodisca vitripennis]|nr:hypothetical protein J6590_068980 [Homalodisca vitripennis]
MGTNDSTSILHMELLRENQYLETNENIPQDSNDQVNNKGKNDETYKTRPSSHHLTTNIQVCSISIDRSILVEGSPTTQMAKVKTVLISDRRLTIALIVEEASHSVKTAHTIVTEDLAMRKVCVMLVLKVLNEEKKLSQREILQEILDCIQEDEIFSTTTRKQNVKVQNGTCRGPRIRKTIKNQNHGDCFII